MCVKWFSAVSVALLLSPSAFAGTGPEFMPVTELEQLLAKGPVDATFKTVPEGSELKEYDITLRGIFSMADLRIVVFTTKSFVVGGMSGSPVLVRGLNGRPKLLGAVAYRMSDFSVGLQWGGISPIEYMDAEARGARPAAGATPLPTSFTYGGRNFKPIDTEPVAGPAATAAQGDRRWPLTAGMPIAVDILEWTGKDGKSTTMSATGTITYIGPNGEIYAFGHPFLEARTARYNFRTCRIIGTVYALDGSYKLSGEKSSVLGTIDYDGAYGIYGTVGGADRRPVTEFHADFSSGGTPTNSFHVRMATSPLTSLIMSAAFERIGKAAKVPLPRQASTASFSANVELQGQEGIGFSQVFTSSQFQFGPAMVYNSSYENAWNTYLQNIYVPLSISRFGFTVTGAHLTFDFTEGLAPTLSVASVEFPAKLKWGQDPVATLLLVSEDNSVTLHKRVTVPVDWERVERPVYSAETKDTDKQAEKVVGGALQVYTAGHLAEFLSENERETETPTYFLNAEDYLENFRKRLGRSNRMLYVRVAARKRSGSDAPVQTGHGPSGGVATGGSDGTEAWSVSAHGLTERKVTVQEEGAVLFPVQLPPVPAGYVMAPARKVLPFEIVN